MSELPDPQHLEIIGAVSQGRVVEPSTIREVLGAEQQTLVHGESFTGRPVTRILAGPDSVLKWSVAQRLDLAGARVFCTERLAEERRLQVHHPAKTWFLLIHEEQVWICNHTPRLMPLHTGLESLRGDQRVPALEWVLKLYVQAAQNGVRLDEGLSNFALSSDGRVYYLDDDLYRWDDFIGLATGIGVWWRQLKWLETSQAASLGSYLAELLRDSSLGADALNRMHREFLAMMCVTDQQLARREAFLAGLNGSVEHVAPVVAKAPSPPRNLEKQPEQLAVLADVHGNLPALEAVLAELAKLGVSHGIVLGDVVGYGPHPVACIELFQQHPKLRVIKGNHDNALAEGIPELGFSRLARWALEWSAPQLNEAHRRWLEALPPYMEDPQFLAVHGAPQDRSYFNAYVYRMTYEDNLDYMAEHGIQVCFHGHTHVQGYYYRRGINQGFAETSPLSLATLDQVLICPGSVGQPRSLRSGAEFALLDRASAQVSFHRLDYDLERTIADMARGGFPDTLMSRLREGK